MNFFEKARQERALHSAGQGIHKAQECLVRVMTTNISAAGDLDAQRSLEQVHGLTWADRVDIQAAAILDYRPDFVGLQEIQQGTVNGVSADMHAQLMGRLSGEYTLVDMDAFVPDRSKQWTPILYRHDRWELVEMGGATREQILNSMHRWVWALYRERETAGLFLHVNLHGPHDGNPQFRAFQPVFFSLVSQEIQKVFSRFGPLPVAVTGDYNRCYGDPPLAPLVEGAGLTTAYLAAADTGYPQSYGDIDHIMINTELLQARLYRRIDNGLLYMSSDHRPCFADLCRRDPGAF